MVIYEAMMALKPSIAIMTLAALPLLVAVSHAGAQTSSVAGRGIASPLSPRQVRHRITINPAPLLYRRCVDWYELQRRPSGTVLFPEMRCWWVRG
jgi:hypothetical protein